MPYVAAYAISGGILIIAMAYVAAEERRRRMWQLAITTACLVAISVEGEPYMT